jgi:hypothetical protein
MRPIAIAIIPLFAGFLFAQERTETRTTTTKTTWNGTLVDAACQTTHTERTESTRTPDAIGGVRTRTQTTHTERVDCPVTTTTTTFGLLTADGRFLRFDDPSNRRVVEIVRGNQVFNLAGGNPLRVNVIGTANGDVAVVETLNPVTGTSTVTVGQADRSAAAQSDVIFDARYNDDRGKLIVTATGVNFENLSDADDSRSWSYGQIKELKREGRTVKIEPHSGDSYEFRLEGSAMSDAVYNTIANRIVASRRR